MIKKTSAHWVTVKKAEEMTGLAASFFDERTGISGCWPEGVLWKWFEGRKLIDLEALFALIAATPSVPSKRGRRRATPDPCLAPQSTSPASSRATPTFS